MQRTIHMNKKNSNKLYNSKNKKSVGQMEQQDLSLLSDTLKLIDSIFKMRFVQKISRPIQRRVKQQYVQKFAGKMESLHNKLERIKLEIGDKGQSQNGNTKGKSVLGSGTHKQVDWKKSIRAIENRYTQVFIQGSFKFYQKLLEFYKFGYPLKIENIQEWAAVCLHQNPKQTGCC